MYKYSVCVLIVNSYVFLQRLRLTKEKKSDEPQNAAALMRERIVKRAAYEFQDGMYGILFMKLQNVFCLICALSSTSIGEITHYKNNKLLLLLLLLILSLLELNTDFEYFGIVCPWRQVLSPLFQKWIAKLYSLFNYLYWPTHAYQIFLYYDNK